MFPLKPFLTCTLLAGLAVSAGAQSANAPTKVAKAEVPRGVSMVGNSPTSITISWARPEVENVKTYNVHASSTPDGPFTRIGSVAERMYVDNRLVPDVKRYYTISAVNERGETEQSTVVPAFTYRPIEETPFPAKLAKNMCVSLGTTVLCEEKPLTGDIASLVDGLDATSCRLRKAFSLKMKLNSDVPINDAEYLMLHFRTDCGPAEWSNDKNARSLKKYVVLESLDSTDGKDGSWTELASGTNDQLDGVIVLPNHKPRWIELRSLYPDGVEIPPATDRRLMPTDSLLSRVDLFRSAPAGYRNDYWIFVGDSLVVQDMPAGSDPARSAYFPDLVRKQYPDRYPIVVHAARGGQMLKDTQPMVEKLMPKLSPANGTQAPTATVICWETGFNDVGVGASLGTAERMMQGYETAKALCDNNGLIFVPVRLQFATTYLSPETLEPTKGNVFFNTLIANLGGVDVFARKHTPYACDPKTQLPYADYWTYTRANFATVLVKDGVHHTKEGSDGINRLWASVADRMVYSKQK